MIVFTACMAALLIVLLNFETIRRILQKATFADSTHNLPQRPALDSHVFAFDGDGIQEEPITNMQSGRSNLREAASFRTSWVAERSFMRARFQRHKSQRYLPPRSKANPPTCIGTPASTLRAPRVIEAESLHQDDQFSCALDSLPLAVIVTDPVGQMMFANSAAGELFGYSVEELVGSNAARLGAGLKPPYPFSHPELSALGLDAPGNMKSREAVAIRKDGSQFPVEISINYVPAPAQPYSLSIIMDRTERNELVRHRQQLAHLTRVSTLGELAGSLAHELNQPLTAILSNAQAAQRFMTMEPTNLVEVREILRDLVQDTHRASEVIRKIRTLVKKGEIETAPLSLAGVIKDVALLVHSDAIVRGIRMLVIAAPELPPVQGDRVQLQQVLLNLLINAFDAMENCAAAERVVIIKSSVGREGDIHVAVQDCGTGVSSDTVSRMFMPFFTSKRDGLGLGLSISRSIVEKHGGRIWAENNKDQGATFYFTLPAGIPSGTVFSGVAP
jgi:two-component system sensor kinase FixL